MRRRIFWVVVAAPLALIAIGAGAALSVPRARHIVSGLLNMPDRMPALVADSQVHYQPGAEDSAREVAALLPDAIARVEEVHGRRFAHPVIVGVYATPEAYAAADGLGSSVPVGVTVFGRVNLSPKLFGPQRQRLRAILTHELSHAHIQGGSADTITSTCQIGSKKAWPLCYRAAAVPNWSTRTKHELRSSAETK
jgi:hypothetical protein